MPGTSTVYSFNYPTINTAGERIVLSSALIAWTPTDDRQESDSIETIHIYSHATIGSDEERPSSQGFSKEQLMLQTLPRRNYKELLGDKTAAYVGRCIIIAPDYEGYGVTKDLPHPYLSQRLTAQQVLDAVDYGLELYRKQAAEKSADNPLLPIKSDWRMFGLGYSQGAAVTLAWQRLIEEKGLAEQLHFYGSICGDGPYDLIATLRYYMDDDGSSYGQSTPHQKGTFYGDLEAMFEKLHGKELSYNNLLDLDAGLNLIREFDEPTFAILKHNNPCGIACRRTVKEAYNDALAGDPVSAFGGVLVCNRPIDLTAAEDINKLFIEVIVAPSYEDGVLDLLFSKKNRVVLRLKADQYRPQMVKTALNGYLVQDRDLHTETADDFKVITTKAPTAAEVEDMVFANKIVKHSRSNAIVLAKGKQLYASGIGQTSRVDALRQAIEKARSFNFDLNGAVLASDAFFPFKDCVELAHEAGITAIVQPGGSVRDQESIDCCNENGISMVFTGFRHFRH